MIIPCADVIKLVIPSHVVASRDIVDSTFVALSIEMPITTRKVSMFISVF